MEEMAIDYEELRREAIVARSENIKKWFKENSDAVKLLNQHVRESQNRPDVKLKKSIAMKGKNVGAANGMYGKEPWTKTHSPLSRMTDGKKLCLNQIPGESNLKKRDISFQCHT